MCHAQEQSTITVRLWIEPGTPGLIQNHVLNIRTYLVSCDSCQTCKKADSKQWNLWWDCVDVQTCLTLHCTLTFFVCYVLISLIEIHMVEKAGNITAAMLGYLNNSWPTSRQFRCNLYNFHLGTSCYWNPSRKPINYPFVFEHVLARKKVHDDMCE